MSSYHLHGCTHIGNDQKRLVAVACFCTSAPEQLILDLFEDDRLLTCSDEYWSNLMSEVEYVVQVTPQYCSTRVLRTLGLDTEYDIFRDLVIRSIHTAMAYLHMSAFDQFERYPLSMCRGDVAQNIARLVAKSKGEIEGLDVLTRKMWWLARDPLLEGRLQGGLALLAETGFTTNSVEQNHGHAAMLTKLHSLYEEDILRSHSVAMQAKHLVGPSSHDRCIDRLESRLRSLQQKMPEKSQGFVEFRRRARQADHADDPGISNATTAMERSRLCAKRLGKAWQAMPLEQRCVYQELSRARAAAGRRQLQEEIAELQALISWRRSREGEYRRRIGFLGGSTHDQH